jgi:hypothetical protein
MKRTACAALAICLSIILINARSYCKCPLAEWEIVGRVISRTSKMPIEGAEVFVFLDENNSTSSNGYYTKYPDFFVTGEGGMFHATSYIDTFERRGFFGIGPDICTRRPKNIEVLVVKEGFLTMRKSFDRSEFEMQEADDMGRIKLQDIMLREPIK